MDKDTAGLLDQKQYDSRQTCLQKVDADICVEFLEVAFHCILYNRQLYPSGIFTIKKKYNVPVQISSHPELNRYIEQLLQSLQSMLEKRQIHQVTFAILNPQQKPVERFIFELNPVDQTQTENDPYLLRLEQSLRAVLLKLNNCDSLLSKLPKDCTWSVQIHTRESAFQEMQEKHLIEDFMWIPAEKRETEMTSPLILPLKTMDTKVLKMQVYAEESDSK